LLAIDEDDELGEVELAGFDSGRQTLLCSNTVQDTLLQVRGPALGQGLQVRMGAASNEATVIDRAAKILAVAQDPRPIRRPCACTQVTAAAVRIIDSSGSQLLAEWSPPGGRPINLAASSPSQVLLSTGGGELTLLEVQHGGLAAAGTTTLAAEVACMDITPIGVCSQRDG
jgi:hypothetical protein